MAAARLAILSDTRNQPDYEPPGQDGVDNWTRVLESAVLQEVALDFPDVANGIKAGVTPMASYYKGNYMAGLHFRPSALDALLVVFQEVSGFLNDDDDEDVFSELLKAPTSGLKPPPAQSGSGHADDEEDEPFEVRLANRRKLTRTACAVLADDFMEASGFGLASTDHL